MSTLSNPFIGSWQLISGEIAAEGQPITEYDMTSLKSMKVISAEHFSFVSQKETAFYAAATGTYHFDDHRYTESPQLASYPPMIGEHYTFHYRMVDNLWHNERFDNDKRVEYEVWQRISH